MQTNARMLEMGTEFTISGSFISKLVRKTVEE